MQKVDTSFEALPIVTSNNLISLHYTESVTEVVADNMATLFDLDAEDDIQVDATVSAKDLKAVQTSRVSISYDRAKIDDMQAATFLQQLQFFLNDPDMLLL